MPCTLSKRTVFLGCASELLLGAICFALGVAYGCNTGYVLGYQKAKADMLADLANSFPIGPSPPPQQRKLTDAELHDPDLAPFPIFPIQRGHEPND